MQQINVATDFTRFPAGRYITDGKYSGEKFRQDFLIPAIAAGKAITINLDGVMGYGSSFLEEAFGGLLRAGLSRDHIKSLITLISSDPSLKLEIDQYLSASHA